ncbi:precorrin-2 C(20)-methyltransferase [Hydrogenophilus islandicus]
MSTPSNTSPPLAAAAPPFGTLYGVSLGPGDPEWITRGAWRILTGPARWAYPVRKIGGESVALAIAYAAGLATPDDALELHFPMSHDPLILTRAWSRAAEALLPTLHAGRDVAVLVEGDASTYATFQYLAAAVQEREPRVRVVTLPGVNSFAAAAARAGVALAAQEERIAILPANYGLPLVEAVLPHFETVILLKVKPLWSALVAWLQERALLAHALLAERVGLPDERLIAGEALAATADAPLSYLTLLILRNPHATPIAERIRGCRKRAPSP